MTDAAICFVLMPFGKKVDPGGVTIDFDRVYERGIEPAITDAGMLAVRADAEVVGGVIHRSMYERLLLCEFAVADLTTANPNVFYELGVRHATRPHATVNLCAANRPIPFDLAHVRTLLYELGADGTFDERQAGDLRTRLGGHLRALRQRLRVAPINDSPLFDLLDGYVAPDIARLKTDVFRDRVHYSLAVKQRLARARREGNRAEIDAVRNEIRELGAAETGVLIDLLLSHRALQDWPGMVRLHDELPDPVQRTTLVREQHAFALGRLGRRDEAREVLEALLVERGPSSETLGLLGRLHKDDWDESRRTGDEPTARAHLDLAIDAYVRGFETDWRDAYPGINALTLLDARGDEASRRQRDELLPVVRFAVRQRLRGRTPDYWDHATLLELAVLQDDEVEARSCLGRALTKVREKWEPATTARNLGLLRDSRTDRGQPTSWLDAIIAALRAKAD